MKISLRAWLLRALGVLFGVWIASGFAAGAGKPHYLVTNDDIPPATSSSVTFYTVGTDGTLTLKGHVRTGQGGIAGGYFGANRINVLNSANAECVYMSQSLTGEIEGIVVETLKRGGHTKGSKQDTGSSNGVGLAMNAQYLYASFTDSNTIGTFQVQPGCAITFVGDITVGGLQGGVIDAMAVRGNMLIGTYGDGSIESFNISGGMPVSNSDRQNSTGSQGGNTFPNGIDITSDGHFALFGDTATSTVIEVSDISSGKLTPTVVYRLGKGISSSNIMLSPDETLLYISNTQGDKITAAFFDKGTGKLSEGCSSGFLKGYVSDWSYLAGLALEKTTGTGGVVYVAEFGAPSSIGMIRVKSSGGKCTLKELSSSPVSDLHSPGLLSIGTFPPRSF
jgi:6-phosphogluconolactonase (cycloisomerase 2 family)